MLFLLQFYLYFNQQEMGEFGTIVPDHIEKCNQGAPVNRSRTENKLRGGSPRHACTENSQAASLITLLEEATRISGQSASSKKKVTRRQSGG